MLGKHDIILAERSIKQITKALQEHVLKYTKDTWDDKHACGVKGVLRISFFLLSRRP